MHAPIVGYFNGKWFVIGVVGETGNCNIIVHIQPQFCGIRNGCVFLTTVVEFFGNFTQISIQHSFNCFDPYFAVSAARIIFQFFHHSLQHGQHFIVVVTNLSIFQAFVHLFGHNAVFGYDVRNIVCFAALFKIAFAVHANVIDGFLHITPAHHKHFAKVMLALAGSNELAFQHAQGAETPAGCGFALIFHIGACQVNNSVKSVATACFVGEGILCAKMGCKQSGKCQKPCTSHNGKCTKSE